MLIEHFLGKVACGTCEAVRNELEQKTESGFNEFVITLETYYPYMVMYVNNDYASLSYYWKENDLGYLSMGQDNGLDCDGDMEFCRNSEYEKFLVPNYAVIPVSQAKEAVTAAKCGVGRIIVYCEYSSVNDL